jgi:hypothetical protein
VFVAILPLVVPALAFFVLFAGFERADRAPSVVAVIWAILIADSVLYASQNVVPTGIFHPTAGPLSFRLVDVAVVGGLVARLVAGRHERRLSGAGLLWAALIGWIVASAALGVYNHNSGNLVSFEGKAAIYLGAMALTASIPFQRYIDDGQILRLVRVCGVLALVLIVTDKTAIRIAADIPGLPLVDTGRLGSDAGTLLAAFGVIALAMALFDEHDRARWLLPAAPLVAAAFAADQRAALLALLASVLFLVLFANRGLVRPRITPTEIALVALAAVACVLTPVLIQLQVNPATPSVPYVPELQQTLYGREKVLSAQERLDQYRAARRLIEQRPIFGWGLGKEFKYFRIGPRRFEKTSLTHNIAVDLWLRTGIVGLAFFAAAMLTTLTGGYRAWRDLRDPATAALLLGSLAVVVGLIPKGLVENLFEKYRMVLLLGLMIGMVSSGMVARREPSAQPAAPGRRPRSGPSPAGGARPARRAGPPAPATP